MSLNKFLGCMYGLTIGDALGFPNEFLRLSQIKERYGENGLTDFKSFYNLPAGSYSDDTQMSLALARAIIKCEDFELENFMKYVKNEFVAWSKSEENSRAPGEACMTGCENMSKGIHWKESGDKWSKGCGTNMRIAPLGLVFHNNPNKLFELAYAVSLCTHGNSTGVCSGIGTAYAVGLALDRTEPNNVINKLFEIPHSNEEYLKKLGQVKDVLSLNHQEAIPLLGEGWVADEAMAIALYLFAKYTDDYKKAVLTAANTNGDSDSLACITGAILGAYNGIEAIPNDWVRRVEKSEYINKIANELYKKYLRINKD